MKKCKSAFTLAEIIVALGIIGVVASITLPSLNKSIQSKSNEATRDKVVEQIQTACQNMIQVANQGETNSYYDTISAANPNFARNMGGYLGARKITSDYYENLYRFQKFKAEFYIESDSDLDKNIASKEVMIDTNNFDSPPNRRDVDQFMYRLQNNCRLVYIPKP